MQSINVFREGSTFRYTLMGTLAPERFETYDDALFAAESALMATQKKEAEALSMQKQVAEMQASPYA